MSRTSFGTARVNFGGGGLTFGPQAVTSFVGPVKINTVEERIALESATGVAGAVPLNTNEPPE